MFKILLQIASFSSAYLDMLPQNPQFVRQRRICLWHDATNFEHFICGVVYYEQALSSFIFSPRL